MTVARVVGPGISPANLGRIYNAVPIWIGPYHPAQSVTNMGPDTVYLADHAGIAPGDAIPLVKGAAIRWDARRPLWAVCDVGDTADIYYVDLGSVPNK